MKLRLWFSGAVFLLVAIIAQAQDFVSKYMDENAGDSTLTRISVSPKMMEEILESSVGKNDTTGVADIIAKLKSMQIVNSREEGDTHFRRAEALARKNSARFKELASYDDGNDRGRIFVREQKDHIVELVLLRQEASRFTVINFTGDMNRDFIEQLRHTMLPAPKEDE